MPKPARFKLSLILLLGLVSVSFGGVLVKLSQEEAASLVIAFYRMFWTSMVLLPFYLAGRPPRLRHRGLTAAAGVALGFHFAFWISSLRYTSVAVSVLLVNTAPVWVALFSYLAFREKLTPRGIAGITLAFLGSLVLVWSDLLQLGDWRGAALALAGALLVAIYLVAGRRIRQEARLMEYVYPTYALAAAVLGTLVWVADLPLTGFSTGTYLFLLLLAVVPQSVGHTSYNWALEHLPATVVSVLGLAEPVLATLLAYWILDESIGAAALVGGVITGSGILLVARGGIAGRSQVEVAAVILQYQDQVWIQRRGNTDHLAGYWEFPGGKMEPGETPRQALARELREELGTELPGLPEEPFWVQSYSYPERKVRLHFFRLELEARPHLVSGRWVTLEQLDDHLFPPANTKVVRRLKKNRGKTEPRP